jgi:methionyl-tRNA formyltransferase
MLEVMREAEGVGLAAPQVGVLRRLAVVDVGEGPLILVNPRIAASSGSKVDWEGCLSFPGLLAEIERARNVSVEAVDLEGKRFWVEAEGFLARVLQHEIDHLDGIVILDRARAVRRVPDEEEDEDEDGREGNGEGPGSAEKAGPGSRPKAAHPLKVAFMGTPDFAVPTLRALVEAGHRVVGVVTRPDRPAGRGGRRMHPPPVKRAAAELGLEVWQGGAREVRAGLADVLAAWDADIGVVVAFGVILPSEVLGTPRLGCVNLHASLLPDYRGAAPIQRALMDGRRVTGVTVIQMDEGVDTGGIIAQREVPIADDDTAGTLHDRLAVAGAGLVLHALELLATGRAEPRPQPAGRGVPAPRIGPEDEVIDWGRTAEGIERQVRALDPVPGAHTVFRGRRVKVWRVERAGGPKETGPAGGGPAGGRVRPEPGRVVGFDDGCPVVAAGSGALILRVLQPAGGSRMSGSDFVNGYRVGLGDRFGGR